MLRCRALASLLACAFLFVGATASAQIDTGVIVGRVSDDSGAVLPGVTVTATQQGTGLVVDVGRPTSGANTSFPACGSAPTTLPPSCRASGARVQRDVRVNVQTRAQVDLQLNVGALAEEVVVTGRSELLQTQSADIGTVVEARQVQDLPLLGRRYSELAFLTPGVVAAPAGHHQPRRRHLLQRQRQLRDLEQLHARRRRQQLVLDQPPGAQPAGGGAAGRCAAGIQGPDAHLLRGVRQSRRRGDQRVGQAGHQQLQRIAVCVPARRIAECQHLGQQPRRPPERAVQPADRGRHVRRTDRPRQDLLLRRLPVVADRAGAVADGDGADGADAGRRPERAHRQHGGGQRLRAGRLRGCGQQDHQPRRASTRWRRS